MRFGKHIVLAVILVALAGYYYYFDVVKKERQEQAEEASKKIFSPGLESVDQIALVRSGENEISLAKTDDGTWTLQTPVKDKADSMEVEELIGRLKALAYIKRITDKEEDLTPFGLDQPELEVRFHASSEWKGLLVGSKSPVGSEHYGKASDRPLVFLIAGADRTALDKKLFDVREKQLFRCETDEVDRLDFTNKDFSANLVRDESGVWSAEGHEGFRVSKEKVEEVIRDFCWSRVREFVQEEDENLTSYDLESPVARISLYKADGKGTFLFGKNKSDNSVYAKLERRPGVLVLDKRLLDNIPDSLSVIEDRTLVSFKKESVTEISWTRDGKSFVLTRRPADEKGQEEVWEFQAPESLKGKTVEAWKPDSLFYRMEELEYVRKLEPDSGDLPTAEMDLILKDEQNKPLISMHLGTLAETATVRTVWTDTEEGIRVYVVPEDKVTEITSKLGEMENVTP